MEQLENDYAWSHQKFFFKYVQFCLETRSKQFNYNMYLVCLKISLNYINHQLISFYKNRDFLAGGGRKSSLRHCVSCSAPRQARPPALVAATQSPHISTDAYDYQTKHSTDEGELIWFAACPRTMRDDEDSNLGPFSF